jgi:predicted DNA-binding transcriptional regulator YafY
MTHPTTRLITLIMLLQRQPNQKASDLAEQLGVSIRTLHRYMQMLDEMGIPVYSERGPHGGFSLVRGYKMPPLVFTPEEAVAVYLGAGLVSQAWGLLYQEASRGALAKLDNVLPDEQRNEVAWAQRSLVATQMPRADPGLLAPTLDKLRRAVRELRRVNILYQSADSTESRAREVDPYALAYRNGWWYLVGYCHLRRALRTFRLDRIQALTLLEGRFQVPEAFDAQAYFAQEFRGQSQARARMHFIPEATHVARTNRAIWETLQELPDGSVEVTMLAPDLMWLASMALSFGPIVTVLEPDELRQMVCEWAQASAKLYE